MYCHMFQPKLPTSASEDTLTPACKNSIWWTASACTEVSLHGLHPLNDNTLFDLSLPIAQLLTVLMHADVLFLNMFYFVYLKLISFYNFFTALCVLCTCFVYQNRTGLLTMLHLFPYFSERFLFCMAFSYHTFPTFPVIT